MDTGVLFNCGGKVNFNDWQLNKYGPFLQGEIDSVLTPHTQYPFCSTDVNMFDEALPGATAIFDLKHLLRCMEMRLRILNRYENTRNTLKFANKDDIDFCSIRSQICQFIVYVRTYISSIEWDQSLKIINLDIEEDFQNLFTAVRHFLGRLYLISDTIFHYAPSNIGNKCNQPEYHMYHMHIELRWFYITLLYIHTSWQHSTDNHQTENFENRCRMIITDLIYISLKIFDRISLTELRQKTPYNCTCIRELWLMIQLFINRISEDKKLKSFWDHVNTCTDLVLNNNKAQSTNVISWRENVEYHLPDCKNPELFCIWIIYHLSLLHGYNNDGVYLEYNCPRIRSNYDQVEKILKMYVSKGGKDGERDDIDEELKVMIPLLRILIINWWQPRVPTISLLWDCFHKRLNQPFLIQTSGPWTISMEKKTPMDIFKQVKDRINGNGEEMKESSFGMFLHLLSSFLKRNYNKSETKHWNQIKSRVYSKFSKSKIQEFSVNGLYNFLSLFLTLAITADTANVCSVMLDLWPQEYTHNSKDDKRFYLIWKGKLTMLLLFHEFRLDYGNIATSCVNMVNCISCCKDDASLSMMASFIDVLKIIFSSSEKLESNEHLFIGGWIDRYLLECPKNKIGTLIELLLEAFEKSIKLRKSNINIDGSGKMLDALWSFVACRVRQFVFDPIFSSDCHYQNLAKLAVKFTVEALRDPATAKRHKHSAVSLFQHFAASVIVKDIRITRYYLTLILEDDQTVIDLKKEIKNFNTIVIQAWVKCSILGFDDNKSEIHVIQIYISELDEIQQVFSSPRELNEFRNNDEAILMFMMTSIKKRSTLKTEQECIQYDAKWRTYFHNLDKWILSPITEETKESEFAFWIYRCIGTLLLCCSPILYVKNQPGNMLRTLINKATLPTESPQSYLRNLGKRIFSMVVLGLETLNVRNDISLQALIRDLFDQYIPHLIVEIGGNNFQIMDTLLKCFRDGKSDFLRLIFETLMATFFTVSGDSVMHKHSYLVMQLLRNLLKADKAYPRHITESIITICSSNIIICYMRVHNHHPHRQHTIDFINDIVRNRYYKEDNTIRQALKNYIFNCTQKYLTVNPQTTFEFLCSVLSAEPNIIQSLLPQIESMVTDAEKWKRPYAVSLRFSLDKLRKAIEKKH